MRFLGLDLGTRTLGLSISDKTGTIASVYDTLRFSDGDYDSQIYKVLKSNLKDYSLEDSTYTYDDFLTYSVLYEDSLEKVNTFDSLSQKSKKRIRVDVRYDISKLDEKKYEYLRSHDNKLNFSLYLQLNYKQM